MAPLFSIITVTYNAEKTLPATLESLSRQTCRLYEHILVDGGSSDSTVELCRNAALPGARIISERDNGLYDAMNKGLGLAQGDYVMFLNAGDSLTSPDTLDLLARAIMDNDYPGIVYGQTRIVDSSRRVLGSRHLRAPEKLTLASFADGMVVCHQAFVVLRKLTDSFNTSYRYSADYDWCIRCLQRSKRNEYVDTDIVDYLFEGVTTANRRKSLIERFRIMCRYYGVLPTLWRHLKFIPRFLNRRREERNFK